MSLFQSLWARYPAQYGEQDGDYDCDILKEARVPKQQSKMENV
jgi:hypothetical protein